MIYWLVQGIEKDCILRKKVNQTTFEYVFVDLHGSPDRSGAKRVLGFGDDGVINNWGMTPMYPKKITGINILGDMLFWTDNYGEPKKINIPRSIAGTHQYGTTHTKIINEDANLVPAANLSSFAVDIEEKHICVIKRGPSNPLKLKFNTTKGRDDDKMYSGIVDITDDFGTLANTSSLFVPGVETDNYDFSSYEIGDIIYLTINTDINGNPDFTLEWKVGDKIVLKEFDDDGVAPITPLRDYRIKGVIVDWTDPNGLNTYDVGGGNIFVQDTTNPSFGVSSSSYTNWSISRSIVAIKIESINGFPPAAISGFGSGGRLSYVIDLFDDEAKLYEFKFPRFSYRYKYEDGEYSMFAPWSEIAFLPSAFDNHPQKGYNLGMTNKIQDILIEGFVPFDIPLDVTEVDILYKEDTSTNVYVVESISPKDSNTDFVPSPFINIWDYGNYYLTSETIKSLTPSNQLLRTFDSVPRKALGQEVTGNRIVYANYLHQFDIKEGNPINDTAIYFDPKFEISILQKDNEVPSPIKTIKSLREYQLGVVFVDAYGRETPVLSNTTGTIKLDKSHSLKGNQLSVSFQNPIGPLNMAYFKFYIKETSGEYYNLAMDRFYDAEDGNVWLAFASSDRNKLDIDTFLILKKGTGPENSVPDPARYKVLAIENEAPDYVKTTKLLIATKTHTTSGNSPTDLFGTTMDYAPEVGTFKFKVRYEHFLSDNGGRLHEIIQPGVELWIDFRLGANDEVSNKYKIVDITCDYVDGDPTIKPPAQAFYYITIDGLFNDDVNFITDDPTGNASTYILETTQIRFWKHAVENRPQFDGRFFVKIYNDGIFKQYVTKDYDTSSANDYKILSKKPVYFMDHSMHTPYFAGGSIQIWNQVRDLNKGEAPHYLTGIPTYSGLNSSPAYFTTTGSGEFFTHKDYYVESTVANTTAAAQIVYDNFAMDHSRQGGTFDGGWWRKSQFWAWFVDYHWQTGLHASNPATTNMLNANTNAMGADLDHNGAFDLWDPNGDYAWTAKDPYRKPDKKHEIWFIDNGRYRGRHTNANEFNGTSNFSIQGASSNPPPNGGHIPGGIHYFHTDPDTGDTWCKMNLSFGPIWSNDPNTNTEHFNISDGSTNYPHQIDFTKRIVPGSKFRWKEDPTQTVYTIGENIREYNQARYSVPMTGGKWPGLDEPGDEAPANFSKNYWLKVSPRMDHHWNPTSPHLGPINGGHNITLPISSGANNSVMKMTAPLDDVYIMMDAIVGVDVDNGNIEAQLTPGMIVTHFVDDTGTTIALPDQPTTANNSAGEMSGQYLQIDEIEYIPAQNKYKVYLVGYRHPLRAQDLPGVGNGWDITNGFEQGANVTFRQASMNMVSPTYCDNWMKMQDQQNTENYSGVALGYTQRNTLRALGYTLEWIEHMDREEVMPDYPAVWETEPKEQPELDIYYEIGGLQPLRVDSADIGRLGSTAIQTAIPFNSIITGITYTTLYFSAQEFTVIDSVLDPYGDIGPVSGSWIILDGATLYTTNMTDPAGSDVSDPATLPGGVLIDIQIKKPDGTTYGPISISHMIDANFLKPNVYPTLGTNHAMMISAFGDEMSLAFRPDPSRKISWVLPYFNAYSFGNGVESNRIRDNFNLPYILNGVKASTTSGEQYKEERRETGLIYSGIYNSTTGVNNLNQFISAEKITKDVNPTYGSIQKLFSRDTDLVTFCEDKVLKILANKDAVYNADGNPQLIATPNVLGQTIPFTGDYGISKNPESFASESYRAYFTDKQRSSVLRLSQDGLTPISDYGMKDWFKDAMNISPGDDLGAYQGGDGNIQTDEKVNLLGTYDTRNNEYNLRIGFTAQENAAGMAMYNYTQVRTLLSFKEENKGWVSFKSFDRMEDGLSVSDKYFTFLNGDPYYHNSHDVDRNTFYGDYGNSSITVLFNDDPGTIKTFNTLNYEGSQSKVDQFVEYVDSLGFTRTDRDYYNLEDKPGWWVKDIHTDMQDGGVPEFINKENKWFNFITGSEINTNAEGQVSSTLSESEFSFQGLGTVASFSVTEIIPGCTDPAFVEYNPAATTDDGSCLTIAIFGCMNSSATNYNALANVDDGSCLIVGCTDTEMFNYSGPPTNVPCLDDNGTPNGTVGNNCCIPYIHGCMTANIVNTVAATADVHGNCAPPDSAQTAPANVGGSCFNEAGGPYFGYDVLNYDPIANTPDTCIPLPSGCMDPNASNYSSTALTDDGSCQYNGCTDATAFNYNAYAINDDGSCCFVAGCTDPNSSNWDPLACYDDGSCTTCIWGCMDMNNPNYDPNATCHDCNNYCVGNCGCMDPNAANYDPDYTAWSGNSCVYAGCLDPTANNQLTINGNPISCLDITQVTYANPANYSGTNSSLCGPIPLNSQWNIMPGMAGYIMDGVFGGNPQTMFNTCTYTIPGCTDPTAFNYDPTATVDDGSCYPVITGCMDPTACNYDATINNTGNPQIDINTPDPNACGYTWGCTDQTASNYNANADCDDGSCTYPIYGCTDTTTGYWPTGAGSHQGYNQFGQVTNWSSSNLCPDPQFGTYSNGIIYYQVGSGCLDPPATGNPFGFAATNYNPDATNDDGSCTYTQGCTNSNAYNYNPVAYYPPTTPSTHGCMDSNATNYSATATTDNGSCCYPPIYGCLHENFDSNGDGVVDYENYNHGSGSLGNPHDVQGWSQFRVVPTGNINYDVNTHDQQMCILKDGCDHSVNTNCSSTVYTTHNNSVNTALYGERNGAGCTNTIDGVSEKVDYWNKLNLTGVEGNYKFGESDARVPYTMELFHGSTPIPTTSHPMNLHENWTEFATITQEDTWVQGSSTWPVETIFTTGPNGSSVNGGNIDYVAGSWQWDPAIQNSCCYVSGCIHPLALNFDLAGYKRNPDSPMDPIYVGVGVQREVNGQIRIMEKADTTTQDFNGLIPYDQVGPPTSTGQVSFNEGGQACQTGAGTSGGFDWEGDGLLYWHGGEGERFQKYFKNGLDENGVYTGDYGPKNRCGGNGGGVQGEIQMMAGEPTTWGALANADGCGKWRIDDAAWKGVCVFPKEWAGTHPLYTYFQGGSTATLLNETWHFDWAGMNPVARPMPTNKPSHPSPYASGAWNADVMFGGCTDPNACAVPTSIGGVIGNAGNPVYHNQGKRSYAKSNLWDDGSCCYGYEIQAPGATPVQNCGLCDGTATTPVDDDPVGAG
jgi:hypothetical protein